MTTNIHPDDDPLAARLRDALHSEADMVHPSDDGLQSIRSGVEQARRPWWRHPGVLAVAAAGVIGLVVGGLAVALGGDGDGNVVAGQTSEVETTPAESPSPSDTATPSPTATQTGDVYVYYVMDDPASGPRLYREQHSVTAGPPAAASAVQEIFSEPSSDPDYASLWPANTRISSYNVSGDTATVDLSGFVAVGAEAELVAVQQLVYTVTANDKSVTRVRLLVDGATPQSGHADWSEPVQRASLLDVQGLVWLLTPTEGASVGSPVEITGYGTAFEGTVSWEVRRDGSDEVVAEGFTQAGSNGDFAEFSATVELDPGTYELRAFESSAENGRPLHVDTKTFSVR